MVTQRVQELCVCGIECWGPLVFECAARSLLRHRKHSKSCIESLHLSRAREWQYVCWHNYRWMRLCYTKQHPYAPFTAATFLEFNFRISSAVSGSCTRKKYTCIPLEHLYVTQLQADSSRGSQADYVTQLQADSSWGSQSDYHRLLLSSSHSNVHDIALRTCAMANARSSTGEMWLGLKEWQEYCKHTDWCGMGCLLTV